MSLTKFQGSFSRVEHGLGLKKYSFSPPSKSMPYIPFFFFANHEHLSLNVRKIVVFKKKLRTDSAFTALIARTPLGYPYYRTSRARPTRSARTHRATCAQPFYHVRFAQKTQAQRTQKTQRARKPCAGPCVDAALRRSV